MLKDGAYADSLLDTAIVAATYAARYVGARNAPKVEELLAAVRSVEAAARRLELPHPTMVAGHVAEDKATQEVRALLHQLQARLDQAVHHVDPTTKGGAAPSQEGPPTTAEERSTVLKALEEGAATLIAAAGAVPLDAAPPTIAPAPTRVGGPADHDVTDADEALRNPSVASLEAAAYVGSGATLAKAQPLHEWVLGLAATAAAIGIPYHPLQLRDMVLKCAVVMRHRKATMEEALLLPMVHTVLEAAAMRSRRGANFIITPFSYRKQRS